VGVRRAGDVSYLRKGVKKLRRIENSTKGAESLKRMKNSKRGMEMVQVGILVGIAVFIGLIFKTQIGNFINGVFESLTGAGF
jgi:hypothetical protein